jgi:hypothetical protein
MHPFHVSNLGMCSTPSVELDLVLFSSSLLDIKAPANVTVVAEIQNVASYLESRW